MGIYEHVSEFAGRPVEDWEPGTPIADPAGTVYRIGISEAAWGEGNEGEWSKRFAAFLEDPAAREVSGLIVGFWGGMGESDAQPVVDALILAADRLPNLKALFLGEILSEECEISWIHQTDLRPLLAAYPALECFRVRGSENLVLGRLESPHLKELSVECGGLPAAVAHQIFSSDLSALEHLELWLGEENYGADMTVEDLTPLLSGTLFPKLTYLGLRDSEFTDEIAALLANAPVLEQLRVLDLSLGTLSDEGAAALLGSPAVRRLEKLDIHHHFCSPEVVEALKKLGPEVDASDPQEEDEWDGERHRFIAVGE